MAALASFIKGFKRFGQGLTAIINAVGLTIVFFVGVGITYIVGKLTKRKLFPRGKMKSYWNKLEIGTRKTEEYYRQF